MALSQHDLLRLLESVRSADGLELVRSVAERMLQELIEAEATSRIGAEWNEHTETRTALRNGHRDKTLTTRAGDLDLAIPKLRSGSFFPSLLEHRRRIDQAQFAAIMEAYVHGVSTRSVNDLVKALGADSGISKSEVSRICADLDTQLTAFRGRPLDHTRFPYVCLDATYCKARVAHQIVSRAVVIATGITEDGGREVLGVMVGDSETEVFWTQFLRHLRERGLGGVRLVLGDHHSGLVKAIRKGVIGAAYQRCRVHFLRNVFGVIPKDAAEMVAATHPHHLRPARPGRCPRPTRHGRRHAWRTVSPGQRDAPGRQGRPHRLRRLPGTALEEDSVHEPAGADQPRDQTPRRRSSRSSPTTTLCCGWSPPCSSRCTTSGSPFPAAIYPKAAWIRSTPPSPAKAPLSSLR
ncbi:hypothetical protein Save01_05363 [Streptomyces avermitilis]